MNPVHERSSRSVSRYRKAGAFANLVDGLELLRLNQPQTDTDGAVVPLLESDESPVKVDPSVRPRCTKVPDLLGI